MNGRERSAELDRFDVLTGANDLDQALRGEIDRLAERLAQARAESEAHADRVKALEKALAAAKAAAEKARALDAPREVDRFPRPARDEHESAALVSREVMRSRQLCCDASPADYFCTLQPRHDGDHVAGGVSGRIFDRWSRREVRDA